jgi:hypothetical protein
MRNVADKSCRENPNTFYVPYIFFFENGTVYEIMRKNIVEPERPQVTTFRNAGYLRPQTHTQNM